MPHPLKSTAKRVTSLARVSTPAQAKSNRFGIPIQLSANRTYGERLGFELGGEYVD